MAVPVNPIITPNTWRLVDAILNIAKPNKIVFKGTSEFKIEVTALSISVSAIAKKNAGIKEPKSPESKSHFHFDFGIALSLLKPKTNKMIPVIIVHKAPS